MELGTRPLGVDTASSLPAKTVKTPGFLRKNRKSGFLFFEDYSDFCVRFLAIITKPNGIQALTERNGEIFQIYFMDMYLVFYNISTYHRAYGLWESCCNGCMKKYFNKFSCNVTVF